MHEQRDGELRRLHVRLGDQPGSSAAHICPLIPNTPSAPSTANSRQCALIDYWEGNEWEGPDCGCWLSTYMCAYKQPHCSITSWSTQYAADCCFGYVDAYWLAAGSPLNTQGPGGQANQTAICDPRLYLDSPTCNTMSVAYCQGSTSAGTHKFISDVDCAGWYNSVQAFEMAGIGTAARTFIATEGGAERYCGAEGAGSLECRAWDYTACRRRCPRSAASAHYPSLHSAAATWCGAATAA
jgi:hypothetical protein